MQAEGYLQRLTTKLTDGLSRLPEEVRARHARFLLARQGEDGGFAGREGGSDLYYTGFALRGLIVLDSLSEEVAMKSADYLRHSLQQQATVVDFYSLLYSCLMIQVASGIDALENSSEDWPDRVSETLETFRTEEKGYAKVAGAPSSSTYHTFLVGLCYELLGRSMPDAEAVHPFLMSRQREDGGFVEIKQMRRSGTNPTAAAIGQMQLLEDWTDASLLTTELREQVIEFLMEMPSPMEGGLRANGRAPAADLLSTFTGLWTLDQLGALDRVDLDSARRYAQSLELDDGGFHGGLWDDGTDVEYTFYGLGIRALLT